MGVKEGEPVGSSHDGETGSRSLLDETQAQFARLVAGVRDYAVFVLDKDGVVRTWNAGAEAINGYRADEIIGRHFSVFYPNESVSSGWPENELRVASATGRFEDEGWRIRKDGTRFWANVVITALRDDDGTVHGFLKITRDLTDRKQAEERLRLSEERFRLLVEGVRDYAIFLLDPRGNVSTWNAGAERLYGYRASDIIGEHFSRLYPEEAIMEGWPEIELERASRLGRYEEEGWRLHMNGSTFWATVVISSLGDENGTLLGFAKVTRDLTERRDAERNARRLAMEEAGRKAAEAARAELERQKEELRVTLASIGDAVIVTDTDGLVKFLNPVAVQLSGWSLEDAIGQPLENVFRVINQDSRQPVENPVRRVLSAGRVVGLANHSALVTRDGREIPVEDTAAPILSEKGEIGGAVLVFRDVTEARRSLEARLRLAAIVESSDDAIIGHTLEGTISSWNRGAQRLYGYAPDEVIGKPLSVLVPPDHHNELSGILERIRQGERVDHFETERVRKDGTRVDVSLTISPIVNAEGVITGASKIARDITARKLEDGRKTEFLAMLAHELRNPLAPLRHGLHALELAGGNSEALASTRLIMERQLHHLVRLVDDLLDISRISLGKLQLRREYITLVSAIQASLDVCGTTVRERGYDLVVQLPEEEPLPVHADRTRIAQAICNLLNNAAKYSEPGSRIWLTAFRDGDAAIVRVRDEGIGMAPESLPSIFDMFVQGDGSQDKSQGGIGVGLAIVKRLIELHGGGVQARSEGHGKGSEFELRLPLTRSGAAEEQARSDPPAEAAETAEAAVAPTRANRILVVDDNLDAADSLAMVLRLRGIDVRCAHDGLEAIAMAASFRPDMVLMDIGMPKMNGYETARRIRAEPWGRDLVLVALTGWGQAEDRRRSKEAGFDHHVVKPVEPSALTKLFAANH